MPLLGSTHLNLLSTLRKRQGDSAGPNNLKLFFRRPKFRSKFVDIYSKGII